MSDDPPRRFANSLTEVTPGSLIYVDARGQVRSGRVYRRHLTRYLGGVGAGMAVVMAFYWAVGGPSGLAVGGALTLLLLRSAPALLRFDRASRLMASERFAEAELLLRRVMGSRWTSESLRGRAERLLAMAVVIRGDHQQALALQTSALRRMGRNRGRRFERRALAYSRVVTLVSLDRVPEAAARFAALPRLLEGDYLRLQRAFAELYLAFGEGRRQFDRDELHAQADQALALPQARAWLTLLAWAYEQMGDWTSSARLLAAAETRSSPERVRAMFPKLADWLANR